MAKLTDLKELVAAARALAPTPRVANAPDPTPAADAAARTPPPPPTIVELDLAQAFADVQRLPAAKRVANWSPRPAPIARQRIADDADALTASKYGAEPAPTAWDIGQEQEAEQTFLRRGLSPDILKKLRRGQWTVQSEIDLHGHTIDEAHDALVDFLDEARSHGYRCVRVIHGKGLTSPNREPVLKGKVRRWLSQWDDVLAYCEAARHAGGSGAVVVLLRGR